MRLDPEVELSIRRLRRLPKGRRVLSVYLETEPGLALHHGYVAQLMDILRDLREAVRSPESPLPVPYGHVRNPIDHSTRVDGSCRRLELAQQEDQSSSALLKLR